MSTVQEIESYPAIIGGEKVNAERTFESVDPSTGQPCAEVARCGEAEINQAVEAAREAYESTWRHTTPVERARILHKIAELLRRDHEELARLESMDTGKPLKQARTDATVAARYFEFYANTIESFYGDTIPAMAGTFVYTMREPFGVTGHIVPWKEPLKRRRSRAVAFDAPHPSLSSARQPLLLRSRLLGGGGRRRGGRLWPGPRLGCSRRWCPRKCRRPLYPPCAPSHPIVEQDAVAARARRALGRRSGVTWPHCSS